MHEQQRNEKGKFLEKERTRTHVIRATKSREEILKMIQSLKGLIPETKEFDELFHGLDDLKLVFIS